MKRMQLKPIQKKIHIKMVFLFYFIFLLLSSIFSDRFISSPENMLSGRRLPEAERKILTFNADLS